MNQTHSPQKWSIGIDIRLPKELVDQADLSLDEPLTVIVKKQSIMLTPFKKNKITLENLLSSVTPRDVGGEFVWGNDAGVEAYE